MVEEKEKTGHDIEFMELKIAHDLPPVKLTTWTFHDKHTEPRVLRCTSVSILLDNGALFTGVSVCSELDQFNRKEGFNRAYGLACQQATACLRELDGMSETMIRLESPLSDINRWVANHAYQAKLDAIKTIYANRLQLLQVKGHNRPEVE